MINTKNMIGMMNMKVMNIAEVAGVVTAEVEVAGVVTAGVEVAGVVTAGVGVV